MILGNTSALNQCDSWS